MHGNPIHFSDLQMAHMSFFKKVMFNGNLFQVGDFKKHTFNDSIIVNKTGSSGVICSITLINNNYCLLEVKRLKVIGRNRTSLKGNFPGFLTFNVEEVYTIGEFWNIFDIAY